MNTSTHAHTILMAILQVNLAQPGAP